MAQGDSIGGVWHSADFGPGSFEIVPAGQVWLITYLADYYTGYAVKIPGIFINDVPILGDLRDNVNIRLFASSIILTFTEELGVTVNSYQIVRLNGVQFK